LIEEQYFSNNLKAYCLCAVFLSIHRLFLKLCGEEVCAATKEFQWLKDWWFCAWFLLWFKKIRTKSYCASTRKKILPELFSTLFIFAVQM